MSYVVKSGDTIGWIAMMVFNLSFNGWHDLTVQGGWDGVPEHLRPGMVVFGPSEKAGKPSAPPTPADPFTGAAWTDIPQEYRNQLEDLEHQFQQLSGFRVPISHDQMLAMAQANVLTLFDFGQYVYGQMSQDLQQNMPWARYGLSADQFNAAINDYGTVFQDLTGAAPTPDQLAQALQKRYTGAEWRTKLMQDANMLKTYGWLKFGLSYAQFQQSKQTMVLGLGFTPTDQQAILQLQYSQRASDSAAAAAPPAAPMSKQTSPSEASFATSVVR
jgi:hypothetical protein